MKLTKTKLKGCFIIEPQIFRDSRGYFFESFNSHKFEDITGQKDVFVQDNQSVSAYGVVRGLHFQKGEYAQAKLVRVLAGKVLDVAVDIRPDSTTYGQYVSLALSAENNLQLYIPRGFAHGFSVLSDTATVLYKCDNVYNKGSEGGIYFDDPFLNIDWKIPANKMQLSDKDAELNCLEFVDLTL